MVSNVRYRSIRSVVGSVVLGSLGVLAGPLWAAEPLRVSLQPLPVEGGIFSLVADDVNNDGRVDLVVTNRSGETAQVLYQKTPRQFEPGPASKVLGFHANELTRLPGAEHRYVLSAEGESALKVLVPDGQGGIRELSRYPFPEPFVATAFSWPGWGMSLAVAPYDGYTLILLRNFQPETAKADREYNLGVPDHSVPGIVTPVDLNGDGNVELLYTTRRSRKLWQINRPQDDHDPEAVAIWTAPVGYPRHVVVADLSGDGTSDVLLPLESERRIATLLNDGKGNLTPGPELPVPGDAYTWGPNRLAIAEDRDGSLLLVTDTQKSLVFYRIEKGHPFRYETAELPMDAMVGQLMLRDVDGDGELDVIIALRVVKDSLRVLYGPLWKTLTGEQKTAGSMLAMAAMKNEILVYDDPARVIARVGEQAITLNDAREFVLKSGLGHDLQTKAGQTKVLRLMIEEALLKKASAQELSLPEPLSFEDYSTGLQRVQDKYFPLPPSPDEAVLRAYYDIHKEDYGIPEMIRLVQIQFRNDQDRPGGPTARQRAEQALKRLEKGESFDQVAAELTENPRSRETGGPDRGFVARNAEPWLQNAVRGLQIGQRTGIVESPAGYEILLVKDQRAAVIADFEAVRAKVTAQWRAGQQREARDRYLKTLAKQFGVTVLEKGLENANPANQ